MKRINLTFLVIGVAYSLMTMLISSIVLKWIQGRIHGASVRLHAVEKTISEASRLFLDSREDIRYAMVIGAYTTAVSPLYMHASTIEQIQASQNALKVSNLAMVGSYTRGLRTLNDILRDDPNYAARQQRIAQLEAQAIGDDAFSPQDLLAFVDELRGAYAVRINELTEARDRVSLEKEGMERQESLVRTVALALQFFMVVLVFAKDYYVESRKKEKPPEAESVE